MEAAVATLTTAAMTALMEALLRSPTPIPLSTSTPTITRMALPVILGPPPR